MSFNLNLINEQKMSNISTATYIKKLVKIIYDKEKQIEQFKSSMKTFNFQSDDEVSNIQNELKYASIQLKQVNLQMNTMENKINQLESGLQEEANKNLQSQETILILQRENEQLKNRIYKMQIQIQRMKNDQSKLMKQLEAGKEREETLKNDKINLLLSVEEINSKEQKIKLMKNQFQKERNRLKNDLKNQQNKLQIKTKQISANQQEISSLKNEIIIHNHQIKQQRIQLDSKNIEISKYYQQITLKNHQCQQKQIQIINRNDQIKAITSKLQMKQNLHTLLNQALKDYEEFAYQISQYIQSAFLQYCCEGKMRSSIKISPQKERKTRFQIAFKQFKSIQQWMEDAFQKIKINTISQLPNQTVGNLSEIVKSFEQKLQICDLTQRLQKQKQEIDKNEEWLLDNLQKDCQKSLQREHSKIVELDEVKQVLKMTKLVNRELMQQINKKEYIISECRKMLPILMKNQSGKQLILLRQLINIKQ